MPIEPVTEDDLTPGPWTWHGLDRGQATLDGPGLLQQVLCIDLPHAFNPADLQFVAAARTVVPHLLEVVRNQRLTIDRLRAELTRLTGIPPDKDEAL